MPFWALASFVIGVGIGTSGETASPAPSTATPNAVASATAAAAAATDSPTTEPTAETTPAPIVEVPLAVTVKGSGTQNTKPFEMGAGDFTVTITGSGDSNVSAVLIPRGAERFEGDYLFNEISDGKYKYETVVYGLKAGSYYLDVTNDNAGVVTFTPLG